MLSTRFAPLVLSALPLVLGLPPSGGANSLLAQEGEVVQCIEGGNGYLRMTLSGAVSTRVNWANPGTECGGTAREKEIEFYFDRKIVEGMGGAGLKITMVVSGVSAGETDNNLTVRMTLESNAFATGVYKTSEGVCSASIKTNELLGSLGIAQLYHIEGTGLCNGSATSTAGPPITLRDFQFSGAYAAIALGG